MKTAIVFTNVTVAKYKANFIQNGGMPYRLGLWLLECDDEEKVQSLLQKLSAESYDCEGIEPVAFERGMADYYYAYINKIWYVYSSTAPTLVSVAKAIETQTSCVNALPNKSKVKKSQYFEAIRNNIIERKLTHGENIAYMSYEQSRSAEYDIIITAKTVEGDDLTEFADTMKKAGIKTFAYPFYNLDEATPVFNSIGFIRHGFYSFKNKDNEVIRIPKFSYFTNNYDETAHCFWSDTIIKWRESL